jgi:hypothetical protein
MADDTNLEATSQLKWYAPSSLLKHSDILWSTFWACILYALLDSRHWDRGFFSWFHEGGHFLDLLTIWLASSGILYALRHDHELGRQTNRVETQLRKLHGMEGSIERQLTQIIEQRKHLQRLDESLSTRRVGHFPQYVREIANLAANTTVSLEILVDCLDYGSFFAPQVHQLVHDSIRFAGRRAAVRILVCGKIPEPFTGPSGHVIEEYKKDYSILKEYLTTYLEVLGKEGFINWMEALNNPTRTKFQGFSASWFGDEWRPSDLQKTLIECVEVCRGKRPLDDDEESAFIFTTLLQARQLWFAEELLRDVEIRSLAAEEQIYLWIQDKIKQRVGIGDNALFTFAKAAHGPGQLGYRTHDSDLLETFKAIFDERCKAAAKEPEQGWLTVAKMP